MPSILRSVLLVFLFVNGGFAQTIETQKLDEYLTTLTDANKFMGNIMVLKNGEKIYSYAGGLANAGTHTKVSESSAYRIGSISKTITATLVMKAVEEGKIQLSQTIDKWFPQLKNSELITIENLLNHHSGIHNFTANPEYLLDYTLPKTETEMLARIGKGGSDFAPGSRASYSNSNYVLLSYMLEHLYNKTYAQLVQQYISTPLQLKTLRFGSKEDILHKIVASYTFQGVWVKEADTDPTIPMGAGGIITNASDMATFIDGLFTGKIIPMELVTQMETLQDDYGLGLFPIPFYNEKGFGHSGKIDGFETFFCYFPQSKVTYVLLCNGEDFKLNDINITVLSAVFGRSFNIPVFTTYTTEEDLETYAGTYASTQNPLVIHITHQGNTLLAHPDGQPVFTMSAISKNTFKHDATGVTLEFTAEEGVMIMKQNGGSFTFTKK